MSNQGDAPVSKIKSSIIMKPILFQISKKDKTVINIGFLEGDKYHDDYGEINDQFETDLFEYKYMDYVDLRKILWNYYINNGGID